MTCPMAMLPGPLVNNILAFCCPHGNFESVDHNKEEEDEEDSHEV